MWYYFSCLEAPFRIDTVIFRVLDNLFILFLYETLPLKKGIVFYWFYGFLFHNTFITVTKNLIIE
ncbi:MAG TPA: hypothetical protein DEB50_10130 [Desulfobacter sp.]|nr:hypothetical protein [Desulfobacter sp.]